MNSIYNKKRLWILLVLAAGCAALYGGTLMKLLRFSFQNEIYSYIPLIPLVSAWFFVKARKSVRDTIGHSFLPGTIFIIIGLSLLGFCTVFRHSISDFNSLLLSTASFPIVLSGGFIACFGVRAAKQSLFPLLFLFFIIPLPQFIERFIVELFRAGSEEMVSIYFHIAQIPFIREGGTFHLEKLSFVVARECSGINSGLSLLFISLIVGKIFLRNPWIRSLCTLTILPIGWIKNGMRIATLTLLGSYANEGFLSGPLHQQGGKPFFVMAMLLLGVSVWLCRIIEKRLGSSMAEKFKRE